MKGRASMWLGLAALLLTPCGVAHAAQICAIDLNGNGDAADEGEMARCVAMADGAVQCPIEQTSCVADTSGQYSCPLGAAYICLTPTVGGTPSCSPATCINTDATPTEDETLVDDPGPANDGPVDADGNCLGTIEIFGGRALRCRPPGASVTFQNCCKDKGEIVKDGMGGSLSSITTKIAIAKGVFTGMKAAYTAFKAGATAAEAASAGANAIIVGIDPTSIAISLAINFMMEVLLQGCDSQDMETGMLRGSGMCHEVGSYCSSSILGVCIQKARGHCCFNTKLGRIIQEQGRPQLAAFNEIGWGTAKDPYCRGFSAEEFQALDFSRMNLSEYYADIQARAQSDIEIDMEDKVDAYLSVIKP
ncbi:conjugal transfer protein TraN [Sphingobium cupriresistens LL01]|uniref:Conjugal transfer protein TraN n=2 Tax=Sphingobium cupriresistens TaxID=1132417 RepID=A0A0J7Y3P8_9SPHN|nr:conjugal transfer protein TraN [Sphingobium cupriresistens LL01]